MGILKRAHVTDLLVAYIHSELDPAERARVAAHLAGCEECRQALAAEEQLAAHLGARLPALANPRPGQLARLWPGVAGRIRAASACAKRRSRRAVPKPTLGMALTAGLLCVMLLPLLWGGRAAVDVAAASDVPTQPRPTLSAAVREASAAGQTRAPSPTAVAQAPDNSPTATLAEDTTATLMPVPTPDVGG